MLKHIRHSSVAALVSGAVVFMLGAGAGDGADDPTSDEYREKLHAQLDAQIDQLSIRISKAPDDVSLYSRRGDCYFFRAQFAQAVADFEKMVELDPKLETAHWRRGIAYFYAGRYKDAARQFEIYHSFDNVDRENGIWRYLSQVKALGREQAREGLLKYEKDDREPFPAVYRMFAGEITGDEILRKIREAKLPEPQREMRLFYAELYVGLSAFVEDDARSAETHLREAVRNRFGVKADGGPGWMWHVGRVHYDLLRKAKKADRE